MSKPIKKSEVHKKQRILGFTVWGFFAVILILFVVLWLGVQTYLFFSEKPEASPSDNFEVQPVSEIDPVNEKVESGYYDKFLGHFTQKFKEMGTGYGLAVFVIGGLIISLIASSK